MMRTFWRRSIAAAAAVLVLSCAHLAPRNRAAGPEVSGDLVVFRFYSPSARRVQLAGDWPENNWARGDGSAGEASVGLMSDNDGDGMWEISMALPPGRYRYLFLVDEDTWHLDPGNPEEIEGGPHMKCSQVLLFLRNGNLEMK